MVKDINFKVLDDLNFVLEQINIGDRLISGKVSCFSLKMVQNDKKLVKKLKKEYNSNEHLIEKHINQNKVLNNDEIGESINNLVETPVGSLREISTLRLISYFISALNNTYGEDFDFTNTSPNAFKKVDGNIIHEEINKRLHAIKKIESKFIEYFWSALNIVMNLTQCQFYYFIPKYEFIDCLIPNSLWNIDVMIINYNKKRLLYLHLYSQKCLNMNNNIYSEITNILNINSNYNTTNLNININNKNLNENNILKSPSIPPSTKNIPIIMEDNDISDMSDHKFDIDIDPININTYMDIDNSDIETKIDVHNSRNKNKRLYKDYDMPSLESPQLKPKQNK